MTRGTVVLPMLVACGRIGFDPASGDGNGPDSGIADLVVHYRMDDDFIDLRVTCSDPAFDGVCNAGECPTSGLGRIGGAGEFGGNQVVSLPPSLIGARPLTVALFARLTMGQNASLIAKSSAPIGVFNVVHIWIRGITGAAVFEHTDGTQSIELDASPGVDFRDQAWHHVAASWDGAMKRLYVDGRLAASLDATLLDGTGALFLGSDFDDGAPFKQLVGLLDDVRIYNRALDASEVAMLANRP